MGNRGKTGTTAQHRTSADWLSSPEPRPGLLPAMLKPFIKFFSDFFPTRRRLLAQYMTPSPLHMVDRMTAKAAQGTARGQETLLRGHSTAMCHLLRLRRCSAPSDKTPPSSTSEPGELGRGDDVRLWPSCSPRDCGGGDTARSGDKAPLAMRRRPADRVSDMSFWKPLTLLLNCCPCFASELL